MVDMPTVVCCKPQGMGPAFTAGIVQSLGVTSTAALVGRFEGPLTGASNWTAGCNQPGQVALAKPAS